MTVTLTAEPRHLEDGTPDLARGEPTFLLLAYGDVDSRGVFSVLERVRRSELHSSLRLLLRMAIDDVDL